MAGCSPGRSHRVSCVQGGTRSSFSFSAGPILPWLSQIAEGLEPEGSFAQLAWLFNLCSSQLCMANAPVGPTQRSRVGVRGNSRGVWGQTQPHSIPGQAVGAQGSSWQPELDVGVRGGPGSSAEGTLGTALV